ncbi:MAG: hypothetical protein KGV44_00760 [Flavobacteriaceae bacterium]|nr:hypothetical protein [Flavobacteriaceae bacterium]
MKNKIYILLLFISAFGFSQSNEVKAEIDTTHIRIGEQFLYKISVAKKSGDKVVFPKMDSLYRLEKVGKSTIDSIKNRLVKKYVLTGFDSGAFYIPQQKVWINKQLFLTDSLLVNVATVKVDTLKQKMFPIKAIKKEPKTLEDYMEWIWWLLLVLAIIALIVIYLWRRKKKEIVTVKKQIPPMEEAMSRLQQLDNSTYLKENQLKEYYTELTDIIRTYIEKEIHIPALESTTNELMETISDFNQSSGLGISKDTLQQLQSVLQSADLVKFAKSKPLVSEAEKDRIVTEQILQNIQPKKEEVEENE